MHRHWVAVGYLISSISLLLAPESAAFPQESKRPSVNLADPFDDNVNPSRDKKSESIGSIDPADDSRKTSSGKPNPGTTQGGEAIPLVGHGREAASASAAQDDASKSREYTDEEILAVFEGIYRGRREANFHEYSKYAEQDLKVMAIPFAEVTGRKLIARQDVDGGAVIQATVLVSARTALGEKRAALVRFLHKTSDGLKGDWPSWTGFSEQSLAAWKAGRDESMMIRGSLRIVDEYRESFANAAETHYAIQIEESFADRSGSVVAYAHKESSVGKALWDILKDGENHQCTVTISRASGRDTPVVSAVNSVNWFLGGGPPKAEAAGFAQLPKPEKGGKAAFRRSNGMLVTKEEVDKHNQKIVTKGARQAAALQDPGSMLELKRHMRIFTQAFHEGVLPAYSGIWPLGRIDAVLDRELEAIKQHPQLMRSIEWVLRKQGLGEMLLIYGGEAKTYDEVWDECVLRMGKN